MLDLLDRLKTGLADRYRVDREIGRGGMAHVFLAQDLKLDRPVALKVLRPELAAVLGGERFLREITLAAKLEHPHILGIHDSGEADGILYYVMPYVEGESLRGRLEREKQLPLDDALQISREVADALSYAHARGVIHRDIKPENILLEAGHAVVADFGIARAIDAAGGDRLTETGVTLGTPTYMSPEQAGGSRDIDGRSDLYSLGCVMYEMLAGQPPFTGPTIESVVAQHLSAPPPDVTTIRPSVPSWVVAALQRSLAKTPADRFNPVAQFGEAIAPRASVTEAAPAAARPMAFSFRWLMVVVAAAVAIVVGGWFGWRALSSDDTPSRRIGQRPYTIVAEFEGSAPGDIRRAARTLLSAVLDESDVVQSLPPERVQRGLSLTGRSDTTHLAEALAHELAIRGGIRTVVSGTLDQVGRAFSLSVRVVDATDSTVLLTARQRATDEGGLLDAVDRAGRELRRGLGERADAIRASRPAIEVMTPSLDAYLKYAEAQEHTLADRKQSLLLDALRLDPDFAEAWMALAVNYYNMQRFDSVMVALNEAARRPERLTPQGVLSLRGLTAFIRSDYREMLVAYREMVEKYDRGYNNYAVALARVGQRAEAVDVFRIAASGPFPAPVARFVNWPQQLAELGRFDEALEVISEDEDRDRRLWLQGELSLMTKDWMAAESLGIGLAQDRSAHIIRRQRGAAMAAAVHAVRGEIRRAIRGLDSVEVARLAAGDRPSWEYGGSALFLRLAAGREVPAPSPDCAADGTAESLVLCASYAAATGDTSRAREQLAELAARDSLQHSRLADGPLVVEALIAAVAGRWDTIPMLVGSPSWSRGTVNAKNMARWLVAESYERTERPDSAAAFYELLGDPSELLKAEANWHIFHGMVVYSFVQFRLGRLYAQLEQYDRAEDHYLNFLETFTEPDPEYEWMVAEARAKLEELARGR